MALFRSGLKNKTIALNRVADPDSGWIYSGSEFFIFGLRIRIRLGFLNSYHYHVGDSVTASKGNKIVPEKLKI